MADWSQLDVRGWRAAAIEHGSVAGVRYALDMITAQAHLNAFTVVLESQALQRAAELDLLPPDKRGVLHGVVIAIKDENDVAGTVTTFGTNANSTAKTAHSLLVTRLVEAGAIIIGKTTMPAFGAFPFTESEAFGVTRNPHNLVYTPGGSSGGSGAAVAAGIVPAAIGGDGGGSIRIPADRCGVVGLKPARGTVPTAPYLHLWHALGVAGPLVKNAADAWLLWQVLAGVKEPQELNTTAAHKPLKIAVNLRPASPFVRLHAEHRAAVLRAATTLAKLGHQVEIIKLRHPDPTLPFLVQFLGGIKAEIDSLESPEKIEKRHRLTRVLASLVSARLLRWAKKRSFAIGEGLEREFARYDVLLTPTLATRPDKAGVLEGRGSLWAMVKSLGSVAYTVLWNVAGNPALTVPQGKASDGLPVSVQLIAGQREKQQATELLCRLGAEIAVLS